MATNAEPTESDSSLFFTCDALSDEQVQKLLSECHQRLPPSRLANLARIVNTLQAHNANSHSHKQKYSEHPIDQMRPLFFDAPDLYLRLCNSLPLERKATLDELPSPSQRSKRASHFIECLRDYYPSRVHSDFARAYSNYESGHTEPKELNKQLSEVLTPYPELHSEYFSILSGTICIEPGTEHHWLRHLRIPEWCLTPHDKQRVHTSREGAWDNQLDFIMAREFLSNLADVVSDSAYANVMKCLHLFASSVLTKAEFESLLHTLMEPYPGIGRDLSDLIVRCEAYYSNKTYLALSEGRQQDDDLVVSRQELLRETLTDAEFEEKTRPMTSSYRSHPPALFRLPATRASKLDRSVLNEELIMAAQNKDNINLATMNPYEEALHNVEEDRHELDLTIETTREAIKELEAVNRYLQQLDIVDRADVRLGPAEPIDMKAQCKRSVARIYGQRHAEAWYWLELLPSEAVPLMLQRMQKKLEEWLTLWYDCEATWSVVDEVNHDRGIDQRHTMFRSAERRCFNARCIMAAAHRFRVERQRDENHFNVDEPHLAFPNGLQEEHDDSFMLLRFYLESARSLDNATELLNDWRLSVERFLHGVPRDAEWHPVFDNAALDVLQIAKEDAGRMTNSNKMFTGTNPFGAGRQPKCEQREKNGECHVDFSTLKREQTPCVDARRNCDALEDDNVDRGGCKSSPLHEAERSTLQHHCSDILCLDRRERDEWRVLFAADSLYIMLQLQSELVSRLRLARRAAMWREKELRRGDGIKPPSDSMVAHDWRSLHKQFLLTLFRFVAGLIERQAFEDSCRQLLGLHAYPTFHIDLLLHKLGRSLKVWSASEERRLTDELYKYEQERRGSNAGSYRANASLVLSNCGSLVCVMRSPSGGALEASVLSNGSEEPLKLVDDHCESLGGRLSLSEAFASIMRTARPALQDKERKPFLKRNLPREEDRVIVRHGLSVRNGMELKWDLRCLTWRAIPWTEDVMHRSRRGRRESASSMRRERTVCPKERASAVLAKLARMHTED